MQSAGHETTPLGKQISWAALGRLMAAGLNLLALIIYSRLLGPSEFGVLALCQSIILICYTVFFMWAEKSITRFAPTQGQNLPLYLGGLLVSYGIIFIGILILAGLIYLFWPSGVLESFPKMLLPILCVIIIEAASAALMEMQVAFSKLNKFAYLNVLRATLTLCFAWLFAHQGEANAWFILMGQATGGICVVALGVWWSKLGQVDFSKWRSETQKITHFGLPLSGAMLFRILIQRADRFLIGGILGSEAVGIYSLTFDFARRILGIPLMIVNLVLYPLMVRANDAKKQNELQNLFKKNCIGLVALGIPAVFGIWVIAPNALETLFGIQYATGYAPLIALIASLCMFFEAIKLHHLDIPFLLSQRTRIQIPLNGVGAAFNILLLLVLIPEFGLLGGALSALATFGLLLLLTYSLGRKYYVMPFEGRVTSQIFCISALMGVLVNLIPIEVGMLGLLIQVLSGATLYLIGCLLIDVASCRAKCLRVLRKRPMQ